MDTFFNILTRGVHFVRNNPQIIYTIFLVIVIPLAFFLTSEQFLRVAREDQNRLERSRIGVLQDVFALFAKWNLDDTKFLHDRVRVVAHETDTMTNFQVLGTEDGESFPILVSMNGEEEGTMLTPDPHTLSLLRTAMAHPAQSVSSEVFNGGVRYWRSARAITATTSNTAVGYVFTELSMAQGDYVARRNIFDAYMTLLLIILLIIMLLIRQARIIDYATLYQRLKDIDSMKDDFVSMAAHELRSPLTTIRGYIDMIRSEKLSKKAEEYLKDIDSSALRLNLMIGDILDVAKLQAGRMSFNLQSVDVSEDIAAVIDSFQKLAKDKGLLLSFDRRTLPLIAVDTDRFRQIMINLVGNAVKYTSKGEVHVTAEAIRDDVTIRISDTGAGISAEDQGKLFQKFFRVRNEETERVTGTGLGLWITNQMVKAMKGTIMVESIRGKGTDFVVSFPVTENKK